MANNSNYSILNDPTSPLLNHDSESTSFYPNKPLTKCFSENKLALARSQRSKKIRALKWLILTNEGDKKTVFLDKRQLVQTFKLDVPSRDLRLMDSAYESSGQVLIRDSAIIICVMHVRLIILPDKVIIPLEVDRGEKKDRFLADLETLIMDWSIEFASDLNTSALVEGMGPGLAFPSNPSPLTNANTIGFGNGVITAALALPRFGALFPAGLWGGGGGGGGIVGGGGLNGYSNYNPNSHNPNYNPNSNNPSYNPNSTNLQNNHHSHSHSHSHNHNHNDGGVGHAGGSGSPSNGLASISLPNPARLSSPPNHHLTHALDHLGIEAAAAAVITGGGGGGRGKGGGIVGSGILGSGIGGADNCIRCHHSDASEKFELLCLEAALSEVCTLLSQEVEDLKSQSQSALEALMQRANTRNLEAVRRVKTTHQRLTVRVTATREALGRILEDDDDMRRMCLTPHMLRERMALNAAMRPSMIKNNSVSAAVAVASASASLGGRGEGEMGGIGGGGEEDRREGERDEEEQGGGGRGDEEPIDASAVTMVMMSSLSANDTPISSVANRQELLSLAGGGEGGGRGGGKEGDSCKGGSGGGGENNCSVDSPIQSQSLKAARLTTPATPEQSGLHHHHHSHFSHNSNGNDNNNNNNNNNSSNSNNSNPNNSMEQQHSNYNGNSHGHTHHHSLNKTNHPHLNGNHNLNHSENHGNAPTIPIASTTLSGLTYYYPNSSKNINSLHQQHSNINSHLNHSDNVLPLAHPISQTLPLPISHPNATTHPILSTNSKHSQLLSTGVLDVRPGSNNVLSYRSGSGSRSSSSSSTSSEDDHDLTDVENLVESYFMVLDETHGRLQSIGEYIDDTEDLINIQLDYSRNKLIRFDILLSTGSFSLAIYSVAAGILGENLVLPKLITKNLMGFIIMNGVMVLICFLTYAVVTTMLKMQKMI